MSLLTGLCLLPSVAQAQDVPKDYPPCTKKIAPKDVEAAKAAHKAAIEFNDRGDYAKAIQLWKDGYRFDCTAHGFLINIANAQEKTGNRAAALLALETYVARSHDVDAALDERISKLKAALAPPPAAVPDPPSNPAPTHPVIATMTPVTADKTAPSTEKRPYGVTPWITVSAGGAALIAGAILLPVGLSTVSSVKAACGNSTHCLDPAQTSKGNTGQTEFVMGGILLGVGAAAVGGGLTWQFLWNTPKTTTVGVTFAPSHVALNGTF